MIHVIDYKIGNIGSVVNMLTYLGAEVAIATCPNDLEQANKIILPGVGAFDAGAQALKNLGFDDYLKNATQDKVILGICLGMQLLMEYSEEGEMQGLGLVAGCVKKIVKKNAAMRIPHMGWNSVDIVRKNKLLHQSETEPSRFYFIHSYYAHCNNEHDVVGRTYYGAHFTSMFEHEGIWGVQFHPEKSHRYGKELLRNFMAV